MANIRIDLNHAPLDGETVSFKAPCNASDITGLVIYYQNESNQTVSKEFTMSDANGGNLGVLDNVFAEGAIVKVILDTDQSNAFVQNPDTNTYLEGELAKKYSPDNRPTAADVGAVSKAGDTMTGSLLIKKSGFARVDVTNTTAGTTARIAMADNKNAQFVNFTDDQNYNTLVLDTTGQNIGNSVRFDHRVNGSTTSYQVLHTGNKDKIFTYGTTDLTAGSSSLATGQLYFVYE